MKAKHAVLCLVLGWGLIAAGALGKIGHWYGADILLLVGMGLEVMGGLLLLYKLIAHPKIRKFLNR